MKVNEICSFMKENFKYDKDIALISPDREYRLDRDKVKHHFDSYMNLPIDHASIERSANQYFRTFDEIGVAKNGVFLEIGAGTGRGTFPFVKGFSYDHYILTDGMQEFVEVLRANVKRLRPETPATYGVMTAEDVLAFPDNSISIIALFACLHHIQDWSGFIEQAGTRLCTNGALVMAEPCAEFQLISGTILSGFKQKIEEDGIELSEPQLRWLNRQIRTDDFMSSRLVDKSDREDKWTFRIDEVMSSAIRAGLTPFVYPGAGAAGPGAPMPGFARIFRNRLRQLRADEEVLDLLFDIKKAEIEFADRFSASLLGPHFNALYILKKGPAPRAGSAPN